METAAKAAVGASILLRLEVDRRPSLDFWGLLGRWLLPATYCKSRFPKLGGYERERVSPYVIVCEYD